MSANPPVAFFRISKFFVGSLLTMTGLLLSAPVCRAQMQAVSFATSTSFTPRPSDAGISSSRVVDEEVDAPRPAADAGSNRTQQDDGHVLLHSIGAEIHVGINGGGLDFALPIARRLNVRVGGQYLRYNGHFTTQGANINAAMKVGNGKVGVDWFPFNNGFHISPQYFFGLQTDVMANVIVPAGETITLDGSDYISSPTDPLHGSAHVSTSKAAPGLAIGWGNISPRGRAHWSFPVEVGAYYIGQPKLSVTFQGSACDPTEPLDVGCQTVTTDPGFQSDLARFIARNNNNLKYASFFPIAQFGVGYRF